jgi:parvulin-like peptidyl-prolyl isomerase
MALVVEGLGFPPEVRAQLASSAEERKSFAADIRHMLGAAEEAKAAGYLARPDLKLQTELARAFVIAQAYFKQRGDAGATDPAQVITPAEIDAFFKEPATPAQFEAFLQDYAKNRPEAQRGAPVAEEQRKQLREHYGRVMVAMRKGIAAGLDRDRKTQLVVMLQQARLLAGAYSKELAPRLKATEADVDAYIAAHPELDTRAQRAKIDNILARVRAGEDFGKLADEYTEDPSGKGRGGDLGWFGRGMMVKPFEETAFGLKPGEVSGVIETQFGYHIVKLDERRPAASGEEVHARHILIRYSNGARNPNTPPMSPREQARGAVEEEKRDRALDEAAARRHVQVAEEYSVEGTISVPPRAAPAPQGAATPKQSQPITDGKRPAPRPTPAPRRPARRTP